MSKRDSEVYARIANELWDVRTQLRVITACLALASFGLAFALGFARKLPYGWYRCVYCETPVHKPCHKHGIAAVCEPCYQQRSR